MIEFTPITLDKKLIYDKYLLDGQERGCEYSFSNLYMWGRQSGAIVNEHIVLFSQYNRRSVYPFPVGVGDKKAVLDAVIADSKERGIPCRFTGLGPQETEILDKLYPGMFRYHCDRDFFDYVYDIDDLADLKGRKYHSKRNHLKKFYDNFPDHRVEPISAENIPRVKDMLDKWYQDRLAQNPNSDFQMEQIALSKALRDYEKLGMDGLMLLDGDRVVAFTIGSRISNNTIDVHFEKSHRDIDGGYAAINCEFAKYIRNKYPDIRFLNREDDMGIEGLRKAKESYHPHHMVEKCWACRLEEGYEY